VIPRPLTVLGALLGFAAAAAAQQPPDSARAAPSGGRGPRPYADVITSAAVSDSGLFVVHRMGEDLYYEIPRQLLGRDMLLVADRRGTVRGVGYAGEEISNRIVRWERAGNRVLLRIVSYAMRADSTSPVARAVELSNVAPVVMSFDIEAWNPTDSAAVVQVTRLFTTDVQELNVRQAGVRVRRFDPARSFIERARSFPRNIEVSALHTFEVDSLPAPPGGTPNRSLSTLSVLMNYSMVLLPERPMMPRLCDDRVGYFNVTYEDFDEDRVPGAQRCYISRYRLEPRNPGAPLSDPIEPITWYIDPATPTKWVPWLIRGVEAWEPVFRSAGFSNAIRARVAPTHDPEFDLDDARHSVIRWLPSTIENAYGPRISDPRSGEILNANIGFYHNVTSLVEAWYWTQAGAVDPRAARLPLPDSLMGEMLAWVAAHEVGHSLGLRHNMIASSAYPVDSLRSRSFTCSRRNTSPSIMDYARYNYVAQPGDGACLMQGFGAYDHYAIEWGYRVIPGAKTPEDERPVLDSLARLQERNPELRWIGDGQPVDPRIATEALGDDPVRATSLGLENIKRLVPMLIPAATTDPLANYDRLRALYDDLVAQWAREMGHVAVVVGGVEQVTKYAGQAGAVYTPVPRERQREAVRFLLEHAFATPTYLLDREVLGRIEPSGAVERVRTRQAALLATLLQDARLARLADQSALATLDRPAYGIADLLADLSAGIFREAAEASPITDEYRRNLHRTFVDQLGRLVTTPLAPEGGAQGGGGIAAARPADARALARATLASIDALVAAATRRTRDAVTAAHFEDLRAEIRKILEPR
jgi:hypothetical protein